MHNEGALDRELPHCAAYPIRLSAIALGTLLVQLLCFESDAEVF